MEGGGRGGGEAQRRIHGGYKGEKSVNSHHPSCLTLCKRSGWEKEGGGKRGEERGNEGQGKERRGEERKEIKVWKGGRRRGLAIKQLWVEGKVEEEEEEEEEEEGIKRGR